jgi:hypothetical protein
MRPGQRLALARGYYAASVQLALLHSIRSHLPSGIAVLLVGDSEFGPAEVLRQLDQWVKKVLTNTKLKRYN